MIIEGEPFIDGGLGANNPIDYLWNESHLLFPQLEAKLGCILSIGTGHSGLQSIKDSNLGQLFKTLKRITTETTETANRFAHGHPELMRSEIYYRFDVTHGLAKVKLDEWKEEPIINSATRNYMRVAQVAHAAERCAGVLDNSLRD